MLEDKLNGHNYSDNLEGMVVDRCNERFDICARIFLR